MTPPLPRRLLAELLGTLLLVAVVVGSGIAAQQLSPTDVGLQLLENALATVGGLYVLVLVLAPVSGAHLNPVVSLGEAVCGRLSWADAAAYAAAQLAGCCSGAVLANLMYGRTAVTVSTHHRASGGHLTAEVVATAGLLLVVFSLSASGRGPQAPGAVAAYIGAAYFFTSSTSFANPAVTVGRTLSDTFAGIAPSSVPAFVAAQLAGAVLGLVLARTLYPEGFMRTTRR